MERQKNNQGSRKGQGSSGSGRQQQPKREKSHTLTRLPEGPYVLPIQAPVNPYQRGTPQPQVPSLFGGNVDRGHNAVQTLAKETREESQHQYGIVPHTSEHRTTVDASRYTQQLFTSLVHPTSQPTSSHSSREHQETSGFFMPSLSQLNSSAPLSMGNVNQVVGDLFQQHALENGLNTKPQDISERMGWHTMQFAGQQMVQDSEVYRNAQNNLQQGRDGLMPPPLTSRFTTPYVHSIVSEARNSMPPIQPPPQPQHLQTHANGAGLASMEIDSEAAFNESRRSGGTKGFTSL